MTGASVPILMYHQVTPHAAPGFRQYSLTPRTFAAQMRWLSLNGYATLTPDELLDDRRECSANSKPQPKPRPKRSARPVLITFDDGYADCIHYVVPILRAHGFTAVFYIVAGLLGKPSEWLIAERGLSWSLADWPVLRQLEALGCHCGAHSFSHPHLAELDEQACRVELERSREVLEDGLGHAVRHLAYPYGSYNEQVRGMAIEAGYHTSTSVRIGLSAPDDDLMALHRVPMNGDESLLDFACRVRTARTCKETARSRAAMLLHTLRVGRWR